MTDPGGSEFDLATRSVRVLASAGDDGRQMFTGDIHDGWDINGNANGGYLLALAVSAMRQASGRPDPISITGHYLAPGRPGPVTIATTTVKAGRQLATLTGSMRSGEREVLRVLGTFGDVGAMSGGYSNVNGSAPDLPLIAQCAARTPASGAVSVALMNKLRVHLRPEDAGFAAGRNSGRAVIEGWFEFADDRPVDTLALMLVIDAFPPPVFNIDIPEGWVPIVELTAHVRGIPAAGPLRCRFHTEYVQSGFLQEDSEVWDCTGALVAQSRQLALVPRT